MEPISMRVKTLQTRTGKRLIRIEQAIKYMNRAYDTGIRANKTIPHTRECKECFHPIPLLLPNCLSLLALILSLIMLLSKKLSYMNFDSIYQQFAQRNQFQKDNRYSLIHFYACADVKSNLFSYLNYSYHRCIRALIQPATSSACCPYLSSSSCPTTK